MILGRTRQLLCLAAALALSSSALATKRRLPSSTNRDYYRLAHSYPSGVALAERDGWEAITITDLPYKYSIRATLDTPPINTTHVEHIPTRHRRRHSRRLPSTPKSKAKPNVRRCIADPEADPVVQVAQYNPPAPYTPEPTPTPAPIVQAEEYTPEPAPAPAPQPSPEPEPAPEPKHDVVAGLTDGVDTVSASVDALKGTGDPEDVTITWYTGQDLENPSCWPKSKWAPSDESFACAVTLDGWKSKPGCFKFLELCNGNETCIFVRVVDSCAGCKKGSKHVDRTKAAFTALAPLDQGKLTVSMRLATQPLEWFEDLWGPKED